MMHEYLEAERVGQAVHMSVNMSCSTVYSTCPVSIFNLLRTYSTPADKPTNKQEEPFDAGAVDDSEPGAAEFAYDDDPGVYDDDKLLSAEKSNNNIRHNHLEY